MMRKETILKSVVYLCGAVSVLWFFAARNETLAYLLAYDDLETTYTDLYNKARVTHFRERLPYAGNKPYDNPNPDDADILLFGDSYMASLYGEKSFPALLAGNTGSKVYCGKLSDPLLAPGVGNPFVKNKTIVIETVEYEVLRRFAPRLNLPEAEPDKLSAWQWFYQYILMTRKKNYLFLFKSSYLTWHFFNLICDIQFNVFGQISDQTPVYSLAPPWLFYKESIEWHNRDITEAELAAAATTLDSLSRLFKDQFGSRLVFVAVPDKFTIMKDRIFRNGTPYKRFLPRLYKYLEIKKVHYVDLYTPFSQSKDTLYYRTDFHWNNKGIIEAADYTAKYIRDSLILLR